MSVDIVYLPIGVGTYEMNTAQKTYSESVKLLNEIESQIKVPEEILLSVDSVKNFLAGKNPDLVIIQNITFANGAYTAEILRQVNSPILLWTIAEPVIDGTRLRSNSLTGAYAAANTICAYLGEGKFEHVYGSPTDASVRSQITAVISAANVVKKLKSLHIASIGNTPEGFGFGKALDAELGKVFGATLNTIEARELINRAKSYSEDECKEYLEDASGKVVGLSAINENNVKDFARLYKAYKTYVEENNIGAIASRCWPDFFTEFGTPVCMVLSLLNSLGIPSSCEADIYGSLSMVISAWLADGSTFFGDPVALNEEKNTITYWHCGMASCDLAREDTGAVVGVHPNRKIGPVMDFGCKASEEATIFRVGRKADGTFRFFVAEGEILDKPKQFNGTSIVVKTDENAKEIVLKTIKAGWEPHYVISYKRIGQELEFLGKMLGIDVVKF